MDSQLRFSFFLSEKAALSLVSNKFFAALVHKTPIDIYIERNEGDIRSRLGLPVTSVRIRNGYDLISDIQSNTSYSDYPYSVFILDISPLEAARIQSEYGVICQSSDDINLDALFMHRFYIFEEDHPCSKELPGKFYHTWNHIIEKQFPCNCIIINDKYLIRGSALKNGLKNLEAIIKNLRQNSIANTDLVITLEISDIKDDKGNIVSQRKQFLELSEILSQRIAKENLNIHCISPIWPPGKKNPWYKHIHNRRILTNYCMYSAEYRLCAFTYESGRKECVDQLMTCYPIFSEGLAFNTNYVDQSEYGHRLFLYRFNNILYGDNQWRLYSYNGKIQDEAVDIPLIRMAHD